MMKFKRHIALYTAASLLFQAFCPLQIFASVSGPAQPEFSNFESVGTTDMVNPFTGAFSYNLPFLDIPGPNGGGYALSLSYHSGSSVEEEASWVGSGWTLSPGAIVRNKQGFADDVKNGAVTYYKTMPRSWNVSIGTGGSISLRAFGILGIAAGTQSSLLYNNYKTLSIATVPYVSYSTGLNTTTVSLEGQDVRYSYSYTPVLSTIISVAQAIINSASDTKEGAMNPVLQNINDIMHNTYIQKSLDFASGHAISSSHYGGANGHSLGNRSIPKAQTGYSAASYNVSLGIYCAPAPVPIGIGASLFGNYNYQESEDQDLRYNGYLYSGCDSPDLDDDNVDLMDYNVEREADFNEHDKLLPAPFAAPDNFIVLGEGIGGSFRAYSSAIGEFRPNAVINQMDFDGESPDNLISIGTHFNIPGSTYGCMSGSGTTNLGSSHITSYGWWPNAVSYDFSGSDDTKTEPYFFRFMGDMGGYIAMSSSDEVETAELTKDPDGDGEHGGEHYLPDMTKTNCYETINNGETVGRSSYIGYHTNGEMTDAYHCYSHRSDIEALVERTGTPLTDRIGEFSITNKSGNRFLYAFPVYTENETNVNISINLEGEENRDTDGDGNIDSYVTAYHDEVSLSDETKRKLGQKIKDKYASMYLLTEITAPNYIDVDNDGPDNDDYGGWTKFNYKKIYGDKGTDKNYFHYRAPWKGLTYNPAELSKQNDDMGSYASGDKEVAYLESVETATHIAVFETSPRKDGWSAIEDESKAASFTESSIPTSDLKSLERLDKITLYAKNEDGNKGEKIKTIHFEYDYSLAQGQPNSNGSYVDPESVTDFPKDGGSGKLTLKKIWFEYGNVQNAGISPYEFVYEYPGTNYPVAKGYIYEQDILDLDGDGDFLDNVLKDSYKKSASYNEADGITSEDYEKDETGKYVKDETVKPDDLYEAFESYGNYSSANQNPDYNDANADVWGNYRADGQTRAKYMMDWVDQAPEETFDPAAYRLKQIKLPSGGEIHIQYEENQYSYVQDRRAMAMVSLNNVYQANSDEGITGQGNYGSYYEMNLKDIIADYTDDKNSEHYSASIENKISIMKWMKTIFIEGEEGRVPKKMYFKLLYDVNAECNNEYISGYANVMRVDTFNTGELYVQLGNPDDAYMLKRISAISELDKYYITLDNSYSTDGGFSSPCDACLEYYKANRGVLMEPQACDESPFAVSEDDLATGGETLLQFVDFLIGDHTDDYHNACDTLDATGSYLRIPVPVAKGGGGVRVKRLLTYDKGLETADAVLYGTEYVYETLEGECSGVATNEAVREENALVNYIDKRSGISAQEAVVTGEDKTQFEGPIGELVLPSPSIGYSRVVARNIYSGTTNDGFSVSEFYTCKDYPLNQTLKKGEDYTELEGKNKIVNNPDPSFGLFENKLSYSCWASQGYLVTINNMNGQPRTMAKYEGLYEDINETDKINSLSSTTFNYFEIGEEIPVMYSPDNFGYLPLGKEIEVVTETRKFSQVIQDITTTIDAGAMIWPVAGVPTPIPYGFALGHSTKDETYLRTHVTTKTVYCPAVVKSITTVQDGVRSTKLNKYFDPSTGDPIVQESSGLYDRQKFDDAAEYEGKYISFNFPASMMYEQMGQKAGCEGFKIEQDGSEIGLEYTPAINDYLMFSGSDYDEALGKLSKGDLIAAYKGSSCSGDIDMIFKIKDIEGPMITISAVETYTALSKGTCSIQILQSNRANILSAQAGSLLMYGSFVGSDLTSSSLDNVLAASAAIYKNENDVSEDMEKLLKISNADGSDVDPFATGQTGKWFVESSYVYKTDVTAMGDDGVDHSYEAGLFKDFKFFDWKTIANNDDEKWLETSTTTLCSHDGKNLEEKNIMDIYSCSKYGYGNMLPYLAAYNCEYENALFESFEYVYDYSGTTAEYEEVELNYMNYERNNVASHSGTYSIKLPFSIDATAVSMATPLGTKYTYKSSMELMDDRTYSADNIKDYSVKLWVKSGEAASWPNIELDYTVKGVLSSSATVSSDFEQVAQTGEWKLYEAKIMASDISDKQKLVSLPTRFNLSINFNQLSVKEPEVYIDDILFKPLDAKVTTYVYDPDNFRLLTQFDDQHFGTYYQCNDEGKLVRISKETERGMKMIKETQYNIPTSNRE
jgi:hypothetical protein